MTLRLLLFSIPFAAGLLAVPPFPGRPINEPVTKPSPIRFADLLRLICTDLRVEDDDPSKATATKAIAIREAGTNGPSEEAEGEIVVESVKMVALMKTRVLLTFVMNARDDVPESLYLALFECAETARLVDIVSIPGFPDDAGDYQSNLQLNPTTTAYLFASYHSNSSQGYADYWLLFLHGDRIEKIADMGILSTQASGDVQGFEEDVKFSTVPDPTGVYRSIAVKAMLKYLPDDPQGEHRPLRRGYSRTFSAIYRWDADAGKFVTSSKEIRTLEALNGRKY